jgi:polysaccharide chain length determinant protein (PEP-CTERM system associated)
MPRAPVAPDPEPDTPPLRVYFDLLRRRRRTLVTAFVVVLVAGAAFIAALPPLYRASATVLIEGSAAQPPVGGTVDDRLEAIRQEALSRARLSELIDQFDLYPDLRRTAPPEAVMGRLERDITIKPITASDRSGVPNTIAFSLDYLGLDSQKAAAVANALASFYMVQNDRNRSRQASQQAELLETQVAQMRQRVEQENKRLLQFTARNSGSLPEHMIANLAIADRLNNELQAKLEARNKLMERRYALQNDLAAFDRGAMPDPNDPSVRLAIKRKELATLLLSATDDHPDVRLKRREIENLEEELKARPGANGNGGVPTGQRAMVQKELADINALIASIDRETDMLRGQVKSYEGQMVRSAVRSPELQNVQADYQAARTTLDTLQKRYDEARLAAQSERSEAVQEYRLLEAAVPPSFPIGPNRMRLLLGALIAALAIGLGCALVAERLDASFHSVDDLRRFTRVPVLASIPRIDTPRETRRRYLRAALVTGASTVVLALVAAMAFYLASGNESAARLLLRMG